MKRLEAYEYVTAVRLRFGFGGSEQPAICGNCDVSIITCNSEHSLLRAKGQSTSSHNAIRDKLRDMAIPVDANAKTEPDRSIASHPRLRPADVSTGAFRRKGRLAAVDVEGICPSAAGVGVNCVATMEQRKRNRMEAFRDKLDREGPEYHHFAVGCWGQLHHRFSDAVQACQRKRTARRQTLTTQHAMLNKLSARITTEVMHLAALMVLQCLPQLSDDASGNQEGSDELLSPAVVSRAGGPSTVEMPPYTAVLPSSAQAL